MNTEIERKFLVTGEKWRDSIQKSSVIEQAYLMNEPGMVIRVRQIDTQSVLSIKYKTEYITAHEYEYNIPNKDADALFKTARGGTVSKIRHFVTHVENTWHVDEFQDKLSGLFIAEIELDSVNQVFSRPGWLGAEVSGDPEYTNASLALR